jgi:ABC-type uncharacterized transport system permease subunit
MALVLQGAILFFMLGGEIFTRYRVSIVRSPLVGRQQTAGNR